MILDAADRLQAADATARARMADLAAWHGGPLPNTFYGLAAQARMRDPERPVPATSGAWFSLDASPLDDERYGPVAIVMRPARREGVLDTRLRAFGLSQREREVAELTVQGRSAKEIALELVLSHYTVQDHLKRIYEKTSVRSRGELSLLAARPGGAEPRLVSCAGAKYRRSRMPATCSHLDTIDDTLERDRGEGCVECLKIGSRWVHLRQCMQCGAVLCCDDSPMRHATAHNAATAHPIIRSLEPRELWYWCYPDQLAFEL